MPTWCGCGLKEIKPIRANVHCFGKPGASSTRTRKRQRTAALQNLRKFVCVRYREASWSAAVLCRFRVRLQEGRRVEATGGFLPSLARLEGSPRGTARGDARPTNYSHLTFAKQKRPDLRPAS